MVADSELKNVPGTVYEYEAGIDPLLDKMAERVARMRKTGKLTPGALSHLRNYFRVKNIHNSTAIEGNSLNYGETRLVVEQGITITGKPLKDSLEARNLAAALDFLETLVTDDKKPITQHDIRQIHAAILKDIDSDNAGSLRLSEVQISGSKYTPPPHVQVPNLMNDFSAWLGPTSTPSQEQQPMYPIVLAAAAHAWFVYIHPFVDGNGRTARILMNLVLMRYGYPISVITTSDRSRYYDALEESQSSNLTPFIALVLDTVEESLVEYERAVNEQRQQVEWARSIMSKVQEQEAEKIRNQYEVWRSGMELLRSYFRQTVETLNEVSGPVRIFFHDFDPIDYERYFGARQGTVIKRSWFFRIDFVAGVRHARYLFFFQLPGSEMRLVVPDGVTLHIAREERPYYFERLDQITATDLPDLREIGFSPDSQSFLCRSGNHVETHRVEELARSFIEQVIRLHFLDH